MRVLHFNSNNGDLESINAVLGCGLVLPKCIIPNTDHSIVDIFDKYDQTKARKMLDCWFYSVNWVRESISGFASQKDKMINKKVRIIIMIMLFNNKKNIFSIDSTEVNCINRIRRHYQTFIKISTN